MEDTLKTTPEAVRNSSACEDYVSRHSRDKQKTRQRQKYGPPTRTAGEGLRDRAKTGSAVNENPKPEAEGMFGTVKPKSADKVTKSGKRRGRPPGRPRKVDTVEDVKPAAKRRGRPRKVETEEKEVVVPKASGKPLKVQNPLKDSSFDGTFRLESFTVAAKSEGSSKKRRYRVKVTKPFEIDGERISFEYEED
jgi:hypothetical protein